MGVRPSCCETSKEETSKVKKNIKKVFNFFFGCCKNKK